MPIMPEIAVIALWLSLAACGDGSTAGAVSREAIPLMPAVARPDTAFTFAQTRDSRGRIVTLLVTRLRQDIVQAVDLTRFGGPLDRDVFDVISMVGAEGLAAASHATTARRYGVQELLPAGGNGVRHVATGTNFREQARDDEIYETFNSPKFGRATPARTSVTLEPGALLDYEVEICARFDRDIESAADFDAARKGFFLCGDFTDRAKLMRLVNPNDVEFRPGFIDAKSAMGFFPTGPFLVVPRDWRSFVRAERVTAQVNGVLRQDARGGEMMLDFRGIVEKALSSSGTSTYAYRGASMPLLADGKIMQGSAVMSGTSPGVIFMPPQAGDYLAGGARYIFAGPMFRGETAQLVMIDGFIEKERLAGRYLRAGDVVSHRSSSMGDITVRVVSSTAATRPSR